MKAADTTSKRSHQHPSNTQRTLNRLQTYSLTVWNNHIAQPKERQTYLNWSAYEPWTQQSSICNLLQLQWKDIAATMHLQDIAGAIQLPPKWRTHNCNKSHKHAAEARRARLNKSSGSEQLTPSHLASRENSSKTVAQVSATQLIGNSRNNNIQPNIWRINFGSCWREPKPKIKSILLPTSQGPATKTSKAAHVHRVCIYIYYIVCVRNLIAGKACTEKV